MSVFNRSCKKAIEPWTVPPPKHQTPVYHHEIPEDTPELRGTVPFHIHLPKRVLGIHLAQHDVEVWGASVRRKKKIFQTMSLSTWPNLHLGADSKSISPFTHGFKNAMVKSCIIRTFVAETATPTEDTLNPGIHEAASRGKITARPSRTSQSVQCTDL